MDLKKQLNGFECVEEVLEYKSDYADWSILFEHENGIKDFRHDYLQELRDEWEWVESSKMGKPFVLLKHR